MAWWGAILGGVLGSFAFGPIGAVLGAVLGSSVTKKRDSTQGDYSFGSKQERRQTSFFVATFTVLGHIAKADGHVTRDEIEYVNAVMNHMNLQPGQRETAIKLFNQGKDPDFPVDQVVDQFYDECKRTRNLLRAFLSFQVHAALADGSISEAEEASLRFIASRLRFSEAEFEQVFEHERVSRGSGQPSLHDDYKILEIESEADDNEVRRAYRRMMSRYHPDKLVSKGLPDEMIEMATEKTKEIRAAYERIRDARKPRATH